MRPRPRRRRPGVYRSRNSHRWADRVAVTAAALIMTAAIVLIALALADLYARSTA